MARKKPKLSAGQIAAQFTRGFDPRRNLAGRPKKGKSLSEKIRAAMEEPIRDDGYSKLDALIDEAMSRAKAGNYQMLEALWQRGYGKVPEKVELTQEARPDLSKLSDAEIAVLKKLLEKAGVKS